MSDPIDNMVQALAYTPTPAADVRSLRGYVRAQLGMLDEACRVALGYAWRTGETYYVSEQDGGIWRRGEDLPDGRYKRITFAAARRARWDGPTDAESVKARIRARRRCSGCGGPASDDRHECPYASERAPWGVRRSAGGDPMSADAVPTNTIDSDDDLTCPECGNVGWGFCHYGGDAAQWRCECDPPHLAIELWWVCSSRDCVRYGAEFYSPLHQSSTTAQETTR